MSDGKTWEPSGDGKVWEPSHPGVQAALAEAAARGLRSSAPIPGVPGATLRPEDVAALCAAYEGARPRSLEEGVRLDPVTHLLIGRMADAFVQGAETQMRDFAEGLKVAGEESAAQDVYNRWHSRQWSERRNEACEAMVARHLNHERQAVEALAALGVRGLGTAWRP